MKETTSRKTTFGKKIIDLNFSHSLSLSLSLYDSISRSHIRTYIHTYIHAYKTQPYPSIHPQRNTFPVFISIHIPQATRDPISRISFCRPKPWRRGGSLRIWMIDGEGFSQLFHFEMDGGWVLEIEWERFANSCCEKEGRYQSDKMEAYSEYPLARLMFWSAAIATVSPLIPCIKIGITQVMARVDVRVLRLKSWYGVLKNGPLTLSSRSFEEATQISKSAFSNHDRHSRSGVLTCQLWH